MEARRVQQESELLFDVLAERFYEETKGDYGRPELIRTAVQHLSKYFGGIKVPLIRRADIKEYKVQRQSATGKCRGMRKVGPRTVNAELSTARRIVNWSIHELEYDLGRNPFARFGTLNEEEERRIPHRITPPEMGKMIACADKIFALALYTAWYTGMRKMEILTLRQANLYETTLMDGTPYRFARLEHTKSGRKRDVPLRDSLWTMIQSALSRDSTWLFPGQGNNHLDLRKRFDKVKLDTGLSHVVFHDIRRSFVSNASEKGFQEKVIATIVGHKVPGMTNLYRIPSREELKGCVEAIPEPADFRSESEHKRFGPLS